MNDMNLLSNKRISVLWAMTLLIVGLSGCTEDNQSGTYTPSLEAYYINCTDDNQLYFSPGGDNLNLWVEAMDTPWAFSGMAGWLTVNPSSGSNNTDVTVHADANPSGDDIRTSVFELSSTHSKYHYQRQFYATQTEATAYFLFPESSLTLKGVPSTKTYEVTSNVKWKAESNASWLALAVSEDGTKLTISVTENTTGSSRQALISVYREQTNSRLQTIEVTQQPATLSTDQEGTLTFPNEGGSYQLSVTSEATWKAVPSTSWIEVTPDKGERGTSSLVIATSPNLTDKSRTGYVDFQIGSKSCTSIKITQEGLSLTVTPSTVEYTADGGTSQISVTANTDWKVTSKPDWIELSHLSGKGDQAIDVVAAANMSNDSRKGEILFCKEGTTIEQKVYITQKGWTFDDVVSTLTFDANAGEETVYIKTDGEWTAKTSNNWITLSPTSGKGDGQLKISVTENIQEDSRTGVVGITVGQVTQNISVTQNGKYFTVDTSQQLDWYLSSRGGTHRVEIKSNESWKAATSSSWITLSKDSGTGDVDVVLTAADNPSIKARTDTTTFTPAHLQPVRVITKQAARYLKVDVTGIYFFKRGGTSDSYYIDTDADITVNLDASWATLEYDSSTKIFSVTAPKNTTDEDREGKLVIAMTGLNTGESYAIEIPVKQKGINEDFGILPFEPDQNWNIGGKSGLTLTVTGFGKDADWNTNSSSTFSVTVSGFGDDENWNL